MGSTWGLQLSQRSPILSNMKACILLLALAVAVQAQKFEPVTCDYEKEMMCPGKWNEDWTKQMTADFCIPMKNGDCYNYYPMDCGKDMMCPGGMDPQGCAMPDSCHPGKFCPVNCEWEKEMMCPGKWKEEWTLKAAQCLICVFQLVKIAQKCKEVFHNWMFRDHLLFYMLKMMWICNLKKL